MNADEIDSLIENEREWRRWCVAELAKQSEDIVRLQINWAKIVAVSAATGFIVSIAATLISGVLAR